MSSIKIEENEEIKGESGREKTKYYCLDKTGKEIVLNVFRYFNQTLNTTRAAKEAAKATCVSARMIYRIKKDFETNNLQPSEKGRSKDKDPVEQMTVCDEYTIYRIRQIIRDYFTKNISPTLAMILDRVKDDKKAQMMAKSSLHRLLKLIGFNYETFEKKSILMEREEIVTCRHNYLQKLKAFRKEGRPIVYTDETWITFGEEEPKPTEEELKMRKTRLPKYANVTRFVLVHAGGDDGLIEEADYHFLCRKSCFHALYELSAERYEKWFEEKLLPNTPKGCVIVLDNASHHRRIIDTASNAIPKSNLRKFGKYKKDDDAISSPTQSPASKKMKMQIEDHLKAMSQQHDDTKIYKIDELAKKSGKTVLRLPPYHFEFTPMEMVWKRVKQEISDNGCSITEAYKRITTDDWNDYMNQVRSVEEQIWITENIPGANMHYKKSIALQNSNYYDYSSPYEADDAGELSVMDFKCEAE